MRRVSLFVAVWMVMAVSAFAIAHVPAPPPGQIPMTVHAPHGVLPAVVYYTGHDTVDAYSAALSHPGVLASVPCTCGCMPGLDHKNNLDCYIDEVLPDGTIAFSTHGLYCLVCQWITADTMAGAETGMDGEALTRMVLERYGPKS